GRFFCRLITDRQPSCGLRRRADGEVRDLLLLAVVVKLEIRALQIAREFALFVRDDGVDLNQLGLDAKQRLVLFLFLLALLPIDRGRKRLLPFFFLLFPFSLPPGRDLNLSPLVAPFFFSPFLLRHGPVPSSGAALP